MGTKKEHSHAEDSLHLETHSHDHSHDHSHSHSHTHTHSHTQTKAVLNRMARLIGHMESVKKMVEDGRDCSEVLIQISAVKSALDGVSKVILKDHIEHCILDAVLENDEESIEKLKKAIDKMI